MRNFAKKFVAIVAVFCMLMSAMPVSAANKTIATKTFTSVGTVGSFSHVCYNYGANGNVVSKGYTTAKLTFNSTFLTNLSKYCLNKGVVKVTNPLPSSVTLNDTDYTKWGWTGKSCCKSTKAVVKLIDTNGDNKVEKITISVYAYGKSGYGTLKGTKTISAG